jgi:hypothetical protein
VDSDFSNLIRNLDYEGKTMSKVLKKSKGIAPICNACGEPLLYVKYKTKIFSLGFKKTN